MLQKWQKHTRIQRHRLECIASNKPTGKNAWPEPYGYRELRQLLEMDMFYEDADVVFNERSLIISLSSATGTLNEACEVLFACTQQDELMFLLYIRSAYTRIANIKNAACHEPRRVSQSLFLGSNAETAARFLSLRKPQLRDSDVFLPFCLYSLMHHRCLYIRKVSHCQLCTSTRLCLCRELSLPCRTARCFWVIQQLRAKINACASSGFAS